MAAGDAASLTCNQGIPMPCSYLIQAFRLLAGVAIGLFSVLGPVSAQIRTDGSVGPVSALTGPNFAIGANLGKQVGGNLFHSFSSFNVQTGQTATFSGPASVGNIIGRVTGGQTSQVDGQIASTIPNANLFLLNPSGWMFGSHATLNVQGSFHVSTADTLGFTDGTRVPAGTPNQSTFTVAQPQAFGFLSARSGAINVTGSTLATQAGKDLSIVGGPVQITGGQITAPAGHLHIASAAGPGDIGLNGADPSAQTVTSYGPVTLTGNTVADVGDPTGQLGGGAVQVRGGAVLIDSSAVRATNHSGQPGGTVTVQADTLTLNPGGTITTTTSASGDAGAISIATTGPFTITGDGSFGSTGVSSAALSGSAGRAGSVTVVSGGALTVTLGGQIGNQTSGLGGADPVSVTAPTITLDATGSAQPSTISSEALAGSSGAPGTVTVRANDIALHAEGQILSLGFGTGGSGFVDVYATGTIDADGTGNLAQATGILSDVNAGSHGNAGGVLVQANSLTLSNRGLISSSTFGAGNAGDVQVTGIGPASSITIDGGTLSSQTGILANAQMGSGGAAGTVTVAADSIGLLRTGQISSSPSAGGNAGTVSVSAGTLSADGGGRTDFDTGVFANAAAGSGGKAGSVAVAANVIDLRAQAVISSSTFGAGNAGTVQVTGVGPASALTIDAGDLGGPTGILANAQNGSGGAAGSVTVSADTIRLLRTGAISSSTFAGGNAGTVVVNADTLSADGAGRTDVPTGIFSNAGSGSGGNAGSVSVTANAIDLRDRGVISSSTFGAGNAGTVAVNTNALSVDGSGTDSDTGVVASAYLGSGGNAGSVAVTANTIELHPQGLISSSTYGQGKAGKVTVTGAGQNSTITIDGGLLTGDTGILATAEEGSTGSAGQVSVSADTLRLLRTGQVSASSSGQGPAGTVDVTAQEIVTNNGSRTDAASGISINSNLAESTQGAGDITIHVGTLTLGPGGEISSSTAGQGAAGTVTVIGMGGHSTITANGGQMLAATGILAEAEEGSSGSAGQVSVSADTLRLLRTGEVSASSFGQGPAGTTDVTATKIVAGSGIRTDAASGIFTDSNLSGSTQGAGTVTVRADTLILGPGGVISSSTAGKGAAGTVTVLGTGGHSTITANGGQMTEATGIFAETKHGSSGSAGQVSVFADTIQLLSAGEISASSSGPGPAGIVNVTARELSANGTGRTDVSTGIFTNSDDTTGSGGGGSITVSANNISLVNRAVISSGNFGNGTAGDVTVTGTGPNSSITIDGTGSDVGEATSKANETGIVAKAETVGSSGSSGQVTVSANTISLFNTGQISTSSVSNGPAGTVDVTAGELVANGSGRSDASTGIFSLTSTPGASSIAGDITVRANVIQLLSRGTITSDTSSNGKAGTVTVIGTGSNSTITIDGGTTNAGTDLQTGIASNAEVKSGGSGGQVFVSADTINLSRTGSISTSTAGQGSAGTVDVTAKQITVNGAGRTDAATGIFSDTDSLVTGAIRGATPDAGDVIVHADKITLLDNGVLSSRSTGVGRGGNVTITGNTQPLDLTASGDGAGVEALSSSPEGAGAGTITVRAGTIALMDQGEITTQALAGGGGNVLLTASQLLNLDRGSITTSSLGGISNGGDIGVGARYVVLNDGTVQANADAGKGGDIRITASQYFASPDSLVQASSTLGINGTINILAPDTNVPGTLAELSDRLLSMPNIQRQGCSGAAQSERTSSLVVGSHGGLPRNGEGPQPALYFNLDVPLTENLQAGGTQIDEPRTVAEANDVLSGCRRESHSETSPEGTRLYSRIQ
jgi:filamentous hemagglutinin family protein